MALSRFPKAMDDAANAVIRLTEAAKFLRDSSGDLRFQHIDRVQESLRAAKVAATAVMVEGQKAPANAEAFMASMGGPATLQDFGAAMVDLETKSSAWNDVLAGWVESLDTSDALKVQTSNHMGVETRHLMRGEFVSEAKAAPLRTAQALNDLISALEAVGG